MAFIQTNRIDFQQGNASIKGSNVTENSAEASNVWYVYLIRTRNGSLYAGITTDTERRLKEHHGAAKGAKNLRGKGPLELVYREQFENRSVASKLEARIKKLTRMQKEALISGVMHWSEITRPKQV